MIIFDIHSWHYKLILWTWGVHFFDEGEIDMKALETMSRNDMEQLSWKEFPRKYKPRSVNFCPYCRAMVGAVLTAPLLYLYRLFPHKKRSEMSRAEIKKASNRRTFLSLLIAAGINYGLGSKYLIYGEWWAAVPSYAIGTLLIFGFWKSESIGKWFIRFIEWLPKRKPRVKKAKAPKPPKEPSKLAAKIHEKHDLICPPVFFVDKSKPEEHK